jgi:anaerobic magnesium-protoporphyrin IX monomethyl ester cyclase
MTPHVCLVIPPSSFLLDERVFPSLGVLKVAASLEANRIPVHVVDLSGISAIEAHLLSHLATCEATHVGVTATMPQMPYAARMAQTVRNARPDMRLILGGPHPTLMNASARLELANNTSGRAVHAMNALMALFDITVCGDGERAIVEALRVDAPPLIDADQPTSELFLTKQDLNEAPFPARHLIDLDSYHYQIDGQRAQSLIAQLGCPFGCQFCGGRNSPFLRRVRTRTTASVIAEVRHLYLEHGTSAAMFFDDELNVNTQFMELLTELCRLQDELGVDMRFRGLLKSELVTQAMAHAMYRAGFRQVLIGFESGHERILANMQKRATRAENTQCVQRLRAAGLHVKALMSVGHAGESLETIHATKQWLLEVQPDDFDVTVITVYPGTPYWDQAVEARPNVWTYTAKNGDRLHADPLDALVDTPYYKGAPGAYQAFVWTDALTKAELVAARDAVEADVRSALKIPYPKAAAAVNYEHSMGMAK